jgi:hypothetical protein
MSARMVEQIKWIIISFLLFCISQQIMQNIV